MSDDKKQPTSEEVTARVIEEYGFDPETDREKIDKAVNQQINHQKELSRAIERKSIYRGQLIEAGLIDPKTFKPIKKAPDGNSKKSNDTVGLTREEAILIAKGTDERIINEASVIAKAKGITLSEAIKDPLIVSYSDTLKAQEKKKKAQLGASGGSGGSEPGDLTNKVGMTEEEHRKAIGM